MVLLPWSHWVILLFQSHEVDFHYIQIRLLAVVYHLNENISITYLEMMSLLQGGLILQMRMSCSKLLILRRSYRYCIYILYLEQILCKETNNKYSRRICTRKLDYIHLAHKQCKNGIVSAIISAIKFK